MSKKIGSIVKVVTVVAGIAAVGTACYLYKDKIKEFFEKANLKEKVDSAKAFVSDKFHSAKEDDFFDDADFFDDEAADTEENTNRGYTSLNLTSDDTEVTVSDSQSPNENIEESKPVEASKDMEDTDEPAYEYDGLSDVSEDEDVLAEESALDG